MKQTKSKTRMDGSADAFIDGRLTSGRVAFPLADLVKETGLSVTAAFLRKLHQLAKKHGAITFFDDGPEICSVCGLYSPSRACEAPK